MSVSGVDEHLKQAKQALRERRTDEAMERFRSALSLDEGRADAHEGLAMCHFGRKEYDQAIAHFTRITQLEPMNGRAYVNLGAVYNRINNYAKAADVLRKAVQRDKKCAEGYYNLGKAYKGLNQLSMAVSAYREAIKLDPKMASAHQNLANVYVDMGNLQQALVHFKQALEIDPSFDSARRGLQAAELSLAEAKNAISPFGRLVGTESQSKAARTFNREMSDEERQIDRQQLYELCPYIDDAAAGYLRHLRGELERQLLTLNRTIAQGREGRTVLLDAAQAFRDGVERASELRRGLKRRMLELRAHEELVCSPMK